MYKQLMKLTMYWLPAEAFTMTFFMHITYSIVKDSNEDLTVGN